MVELSSCNRDHMTCKAENVYHLVIYRKSLLIPELYHQERVNLLAPFPKRLQSAYQVGLVIYLLNTYL